MVQRLEQDVPGAKTASGSRVYRQSKSDVQSRRLLLMQSAKPTSDRELTPLIATTLRMGGQSLVPV
eukprot:CAMPEP_0206484230 /NCGR_PEP_ID=MMETSP0324_2-20121206/39863_1 /ASSEMBLY_ACC=CAM_ASM_000836 /TAXON_ID=2866 /ORGANISM="Crypthecodinium cohnii, Strain Seligo" /LENGTH=65 /DNA_ID=CAMNT_0053962363 /DNA_START=604 /DNA_END=801 /DNA_ORIENTATION=-